MDIPFSWVSLEADVSQRLQIYVRNLPSKEIDALEWLVRFEPLAKDAKSRIARASRAELRSSFFFSLDGPIADRYVEIYIQSKSYDQANDWAKEIIGNIDDFDEVQLRKIVTEGAGNSEITGSFRFSDVIAAVRKTGKIERNDFDKMLKELGLGEYSDFDGSDIPF